MASVIIQIKDKKESMSLSVKDMDLSTVYNHVSTLFNALEEVDGSVTMTFFK